MADRNIAFLRQVEPTVVKLEGGEARLLFTLRAAAAMEAELGTDMSLLRVDGGASANNFLMQFQSDVLGVRVLRPKVVETTAMGAAMLAGRAVGLWNDAQLRGLQTPDREFSPAMDEAERNRLLRQWKRATERSAGWAYEG